MRNTASSKSEQSAQQNRAAENLMQASCSKHSAQVCDAKSINPGNAMKWNCGARAVIFSVAISVGVFGQDTGPDLTLRADTTLVQIPVAVTDSLNRFVLGLEKEDFHLLEDGVEQNVAHFSGEDAPLSVGLVFDESGSMGYKMRTSMAAVAQFLKTMNARRRNVSGGIQRHGDGLGGFHQ